MSDHLNIPEGWKLKPLSFLIDGLESGVSVNSQDVPATLSEFGVLKTSCISMGKFYENENKTILSKDISRARINPIGGAIIISRMNTPELVGESGLVVRSAPNLFLPDRLWQTKFKVDVPVDSYWLASLLQETSIKKKIQDTATGTSNSMKNISKQSFLSLEIPIPPYAEQKKIAKVLASIDEQIEATKKLIEKNKDIKLGLIDSLILGDLRADINTPVKGNIQVLTGYPFNSQEFNGDGRGYPLLRIRDLSSSSTEIHYSGPVPEGFWVEKGDVLIGMDGEFNLRVWSGMKALLNQRVMRLRELADSKISLKYLTYYLPSFLLDIENKTPQTTVKHLSHLSILNAEFKFPERNRQNEVAEIIDSVDCLIDAEKLNLAKLKFQKEGLMQDLLTGRVSVN